MQYILSSQGIRIEQEAASFAARLLAFAIDFILMAIVAAVLYNMCSLEMFFFLNTDFAYFMAFFIPYLYPLVYETVASGQTIGKKLLHIRVVTLDGGGPKMTSFILRWLLLPIDILGSMGIGPLCVFFTKHQQRLGDLVAGTWVVRTQEYKKVEWGNEE